MFGPLLLVCKQLFLQLIVFFFVLASSARSGYRIRHDFAILNGDQTFRRGPDHLEIAQIDIEKIWRRILRAQSSVDIERFGFGLDG
ncbi:hypothetical protein SDC9_118163 [bioreactor metagenome]|uniref:Uncharacterized protein n=1 Tax=bioreactor metagenome TaxID=1076179 RepID=A0A645C0A4_9ZZZZ